MRANHSDACVAGLVCYSFMRQSEIKIKIIDRINYLMIESR